MGRFIFILGATGVGKSGFAHEKAANEGAAIFSLDAMQIYREADIGTSKPSARERDEVEYGGLDLVELGAAFDVNRYLAAATDFFAQSADRPVLIVGGTGLYFRALTRGMCAAPPGSTALRDELRSLSLQELRARLTRVDPAILSHLDTFNPRRLIRAIEVMETTGRSLLVWQKEAAPPLITDYTALWLQRGKAELLGRLERRLDQMLAAGWLEEVRALVERHGEAVVIAFPAIGYRELAEVTAGRRTLDAAKRDILVATRQYAKRQLTWFAAEPSLKAVTLSGTTAPSSVRLSQL